VRRYAIVDNDGELARLAGKDGKPGPGSVRKLNAYGRRQVRRHHPDLRVVLLEHYARARETAETLKAAPVRDARSSLRGRGVSPTDPRYQNDPVGTRLALIEAESKLDGAALGPGGDHPGQGELLVPDDAGGELRTVGPEGPDRVPGA